MNLFGYLFNWEGFNTDSPETQNHITQFRAAMQRSKRFDDATSKLSHAQKSRIPDRWNTILFESSEPLAGEEGSLFENYHYRVFVRVNELTRSVILAASRYRITEAAVSTFNLYVTPKLQRKIIRVQDLSDHLLEETGPKKFAITYLKADIPSFGSSLRSIALEGDDISGSGFVGRIETGEGSPPRGSLHRRHSSLVTRQIGVRSTLLPYPMVWMTPAYAHRLWNAMALKSGPDSAPLLVKSGASG